MNRILIGFMVHIFFLVGCKSNDRSTHYKAFDILDSARTHIRFINDLPEMHNGLSVVDYLYYYNGAGVAAGDLNNDGLCDLFFVSTRGKNKLYINKGGLQFEDISSEAGIEGYSDWKTGVTMVDINADGFLDIYVCAVGNSMGLEGSNELYINNQDNTFTEKAADYNLDYTGFSTQSAFFDYDHDGDLDMYLVTHAQFLSRSFNRVIADNLPSGAANDHLFRNDDGKFIDVSESSGVTKVKRAYGLGITILDYNNDGWQDIYVTNDFYEADYLLKNNGDGTFEEHVGEKFGHAGLYSRGCSSGDINNDGFVDLVTVDFASKDSETEKELFLQESWEATNYKMTSFGHHYQVPRNCLQINNSGKSFSDVAIIAGISATGSSWSPFLADFNNDGFKDIVTTGGAAARLNDLSYLKFAGSDSMRYAMHLSDRMRKEAISKITNEPSRIIFFQNSGRGAFCESILNSPMPSNGIATGSTYADLDNDGDIDLITNVINGLSSIYENRSNQNSDMHYIKIRLRSSNDKNTFGIGCKVYVKTGAGWQTQEVSPIQGFLSSTEPLAHFGLGGDKVIDTLVVKWNDGGIQVTNNVPADTLLIFNHSLALRQTIKMSLIKERALFRDVTEQTSISYSHRENKYADYYREKHIPFLVSTEGPKIVVGDVNGDALEDFYVGGAKYQFGRLFIQDDHGRFAQIEQPAFVNDSIYEDVDAAFFDADGDRDLDLYVVSGGNEFFGKMKEQFDRFYLNDGKGNFSRDYDALPEMFDNKSCVRPMDIDNDGDVDLFVGGRVVAYSYGKSPRSYLLLNNGKGKFKDATPELCPELMFAGMITDATWTDTDLDEDMDLVVVGDWMPLSIFENKDGRFRPVSDLLADGEDVTRNIHGLWQCVAAADFDEDKDVDLVAGNLGINSTLRRNGDQSVVMLYHGDFNGDKKNDLVTVDVDALGKTRPLMTTEEFEVLFDKVLTARSLGINYAKKNVAEVFDAILTEANPPLMMNQFASLYLENNGGNKFTPHLLPFEAQTSKIFSFFVDYFNSDGKPDLLLGGNLKGASVYQGPYDGGLPLVLQNNGRGVFETSQTIMIDSLINTEIRDIKGINTKGGRIYLFTTNNGSLRALKRN